MSPMAARTEKMIADALGLKSTSDKSKSKKPIAMYHVEI